MTITNQIEKYLRGGIKIQYLQAQTNHILKMLLFHQNMTKTEMT